MGQSEIHASKDLDFNLQLVVNVSLWKLEPCQITEKTITRHDKQMQQIFKVFGSFKFKKSKMEIFVVLFVKLKK